MDDGLQEDPENFNNTDSGNNQPQNQNIPPEGYFGYGNGQYYGQAPAPRVRKEGGDGYALTCLILGIISICLFASFINVVTAIISFVFGAIYLSGYIVKHKAQAVSGIVLSILSIVLGIVAWVSLLESPLMKSMINGTGADAGASDYFYEQVEQYRNGEISDTEFINNILNNNSDSSDEDKESDMDSDDD